jgi:hypothetical protein
MISRRATPPPGVAGNRYRRAIVKYDAAGEEIVLVTPQGSFPRRLLRMLGIDRRIPLHDSREDALRAVIAARTPPSRRAKSEASH